MQVHLTYPRRSDRLGTDGCGGATAAVSTLLVAVVAAAAAGAETGVDADNMDWVGDNTAVTASTAAIQPGIYAC